MALALRVDVWLGRNGAAEPTKFSANDTSRPNPSWLLEKGTNHTANISSYFSWCEAVHFGMLCARWFDFKIIQPIKCTWEIQQLIALWKTNAVPAVSQPIEGVSAGILFIWHVCSIMTFHKFLHCQASAENFSSFLMGAQLCHGQGMNHLKFLDQTMSNGTFRMDWKVKLCFQ